MSDNNESVPPTETDLDDVTTNKGLRFVWLASVVSSLVMVTFLGIVVGTVHGVFDPSLLGDRLFSVLESSVYIVLAWLFGVGILARINEYQNGKK